MAAAPRMPSTLPQNSSGDSFRIAFRFRQSPLRPTRPRLTALGNDYGYNAVFSRQIQALGNTGDIAIGISTSGNSPNVLEALDVARSERIVHHRLYRREWRQNERPRRRSLSASPAG